MKRARTMLAMAALVLGASGQAAEPVGVLPAGIVPLFGVTVDAVDDVNGVVDALAHLSHTPTARIVFDEGMDAAHYAAPVAAIRRVAYVMGELIDSSTLRLYSVRQVGARATDYLDVLGDSVDLWEIGNEINGEWTGRTHDVVDKTLAAYDAVKQRGARTALTLYYNEGCAEQPSRAMFNWAARNLPARLRNGVDYVFISYYEDDCKIAPPEWDAVFARLGELFPHAALGFGEVGTRHADRKRELIARYYGLTVHHPRYVGGYFWWSFRQDMVPRSRPLWRHIDAAFQTMQARPPAPLTR
ncbi:MULTISPECIES: hypothetical protein [Ralstonia solanacearum species complex]|uniref:hypothetical protein n=1 Tax=Ralstonia solanacearum species complex TaxID=3116862 RepID=UPI000E593F38|nr:hypothetical protein [Ralstonia solanacearum]AXV78972.1 hypothetical protein CJO76_18445 [Ralstonia solanacearum]AXV92990.1 hypothetical protein CJO79_18430 [Ralstonia solanacearum]AXW21052.1 hypothetical protein CJO85_18495 [Ralstonia solanacearum]AXW77887.1 hypothetical protein CJO97_18425 [Ralstonia solanacearum]